MFRSWMEKTWLTEHKSKIYIFLIRSYWREVLYERKNNNFVSTI